MRIAIYNSSFGVLGGAERRSITLAAHLSKKHNVTIVTELPVSHEKLHRAFGIDCSRVNFVVSPIWKYQRWRFWYYDVFIANGHYAAIPNHAPLGIFSCMFPYPFDRVLNLETYHIIAANSHFTASWIERVWQRTAQVIYSAPQNMGPPGLKQNKIVSIGRFLAPVLNSNAKHQRVLLNSFCNMVDGGLQGWELVLIGSVHPTASDQAYLAELIEAAKGYPVRILTNLDGESLREHMREASIYWHAAGYGTSEIDEPQAQEHFGLSVIEAMSAGAVPLAYKSGGPRETIRDGETGYLWSTPPELEQTTLRLINSPETLRHLADAAVEQARKFGVEVYLGRVDEIIRQHGRAHSLVERLLRLTKLLAASGRRRLQDGMRRLISRG